jgi:hypothetical protein
MGCPKLTPFPRLRADSPEAFRRARLPRLYDPGPVRPYRAADLEYVRKPNFAVQTIGATSTNGSTGLSGSGGNTNFTASGTSPTWGGTTVAGSYLALVIGWSSTPGTVTVSGSWAIHGTIHNAGNTYLSIYEIVNAASQTSGTGPTITWGTSVNACAVCMIEVKGTATSSPQDGSDQTASGATTTPAGGAITTASANDCILCGLNQSINSAATIDTWSSPLPAGTTLISSTASAAGGTGFKGACRVGFNYQIVTSTQTGYTPSVTSNGTQQWFGLTYAVKAAATFVGDEEGMTISFRQNW